MELWLRCEGPSPMHVAEREQADHMIDITCSRIEFLMRLAKMKGTRWTFPN